MAIELQRRHCRVQIELGRGSHSAAIEALQGLIDELEAKKECLKATTHLAIPRAHTTDLSRLSLSPCDIPLCEAIVNKRNIENLDRVADFLREHGEALLPTEDGRALVAAMIEKTLCNGNLFLLATPNQDFVCEFLFHNFQQLISSADETIQQQLLHSLIAIVASDEDGRCPLDYNTRKTAAGLIAALTH